METIGVQPTGREVVYRSGTGVQYGPNDAPGAARLLEGINMRASVQTGAEKVTNIQDRSLVPSTIGRIARTVMTGELRDTTRLNWETISKLKLPMGLWPVAGVSPIVGTPSKDITMKERYSKYRYTEGYTLTVPEKVRPLSPGEQMNAARVLSGVNGGLMPLLTEDRGHIGVRDYVGYFSEGYFPVSSAYWRRGSSRLLSVEVGHYHKHDTMLDDHFACVLAGKTFRELVQELAKNTQKTPDGFKKTANILDSITHDMASITLVVLTSTDKSQPKTAATQITETVDRKIIRPLPEGVKPVLRQDFEDRIAQDLSSLHQAVHHI